MKIFFKIILIISLLMHISCSGNHKKARTSGTEEEFLSARDVLVEKIQSACSGRDFTKIKSERDRTLNNLLKKSEAEKVNFRNLLLKARILLVLEKNIPAEKIIRELEKEHPESLKVKTLKICLLIRKAKHKEALSLFSNIRSRLNKESVPYFIAALTLNKSPLKNKTKKQLIQELFNIKSPDKKLVPFIALAHLEMALINETEKSDVKIAEKHRLSALRLCPGPYFQYMVYKKTAASYIASEKYAEAVKLLSEGVAGISEPGVKKLLRSEIRHTELLKKTFKFPLPLRDISASVKTNKSIKNHRLIIYWSAWDKKSLEILRFLNEKHNDLLSKKFQITAITKLYGKISDTKSSTLRNADYNQEINFYKAMVKKLNLKFQVKLSETGKIFTDYSIISLPAVIMTDRENRIHSIQTGQQNIISLIKSI